MAFQFSWYSEDLLGLAIGKTYSDYQNIIANSLELAFE
jgi:hypothetical protein